MPTVINNPSTGTNDGGSGFIVGIILVVLLVVLFLWYGIPRLQDDDGDVNIPDVNVNVTP